MKNKKLKMENEKFIISRKVEKLKSEKGDNPLLILPPFRGEIERGDLSTKRNVSPTKALVGDVSADPWSAKK